MTNSVICPTILATDKHVYREQIEKVAGFAERIQIDVMDGVFAQPKSVDISSIWAPDGCAFDIHVMYKNPQDYLDDIINVKPNMAIVHAESDCDIAYFASLLRDQDIKTGIAILPETQPEEIEYLLWHVQHVLLFGGKLGSFGGHADLHQAEKARKLKEMNRHLELGWDGGANIDNIKVLLDAGIDVVNVGSYIQKSENPAEAYASLRKVCLSK